MGLSAKAVGDSDVAAQASKAAAAKRRITFVEKFMVDCFGRKVDP